MIRRQPQLARIAEFAFSVNPQTGSAAIFLWGPRQTGKSTLVRERFPAALRFDLLDTALAAELAIRPALLRERVLAEKAAVVVVDEVQKVPVLLEEVHWLLENTATRFVLCGSSARRLRRQARNLMGGRATEMHLFPLTTREIPDLELERALNFGTLPRHYLTDEPRALLRAYVNLYIKEEIIDESLTRNVPAFARFLQVVGLTHGRQLNYANIAREAGVAASTVRNYFQILEDTLLGFELEPWRQSRQRRLVETAKFFLFDVGVAHALNPELTRVAAGSDTFGRAFEHLLINEVRAYLSYRSADLPLRYWRTSSGFEVDLIVGRMELAIELTATTRVRREDLRGILALREEHEVRRALVVCREGERRQLEDGLEIIPWQQFCAELWGNQLIA